MIPEEWLNGIDTSKLSKHNLAARTLANEVCPGFDILEKDEYGKPYFDSAKHKISITHSGKFAGFLLNEVGECGIDMEQITPRIKPLGSKFIRQDEESYSELGIEGMYMVWCAKEALYKYYGLKALDFKEHLRVEPLDKIEQSGQFKGFIQKESYNRVVDLNYEFIDEYLVVYTL